MKYGFKLKKKIFLFQKCLKNICDNITSILEKKSG